MDLTKSLIWKQFKKTATGVVIDMLYVCYMYVIVFSMWFLTAPVKGEAGEGSMRFNAKVWGNTRYTEDTL